MPVGSCVFNTTDGHDMREINTIILHCAYTFPEMDIGAAEIRRWHVQDNRWNDIGYHYVIRRDGTVETGRPIEVVGAHVAGHNQHSIGICLVGGKAEPGRQNTNFTAEQWVALSDLVKSLLEQFPSATVAGHNNFDRSKSCPTFDAKAWAENLLK